MQPTFTSLNYTYKKEDSGLWVLNADDIPVERTHIHDQQIVHLDPGSVGGNHTHPRTEWFIAIGPLTLYWLDDQGQRHQRAMNPEGQLVLIEIPPQLPHAVKNTSDSQPAVLFEYADAKQYEVEPVELV